MPTVNRSRGAADCDLVFGNEISWIVRWNGGKALRKLVGQRERMRIEMKAADLYSFQFR